MEKVLNIEHYVDIPDGGSIEFNTRRKVLFEAHKSKCNQLAQFYDVCFNMYNSMF